MKKLAILFIICGIASESSFSQQMSFGLKSSFLILDSKLVTNFDQLPYMEVKSRPSYAFGITISEQIKRFGIRVEPRFIIKGYNLETPIDDIDVYRNNYASMPIIFSYTLFHNLNFDLGPEFSYMLNSKVKYSGGDSFLKNSSNNLKSFEISALAGLSYRFKILDLGIRYGIGLTPFDEGQFIIYSDPNSTPPVNYTFTHRYFEFYLSINIPRIKK